MAQKPVLLLKDYLELDSDSDSSNGFTSFPRKPESCTTVRFLIETERCRARLVRSRSRGALSKLSDALAAAIKNLPVSSPNRPTPTLSDRLKFWRIKSRRTEREKKATVTVKDIVRLSSFDLYGERRSLYLPSPAASSRSSSCCSDGEDSFLSSSTSGGSSECFAEPPKITSPSEGAESKEEECAGCQSEEEKEQLSPVSVMDFPYQDEGDDEDDDDDEDDKDSPRFEQSLASIERTTHELLQKIRRFESLAQLDPLDLELRFESLEDEDETCSDEGHVAELSEEITAWDLIRRLRRECHVDPDSEKLLVDLFLEGLSWSADPTSAEIEGLVEVARDWTNGEGYLRAEEHGKAQLSEMERNGRWRGFEGGKEDVAADLEGRVLGALLQELVADLITTG